MLHTLTFSNVYLNKLKTLDRSIRSIVRCWLRLPSDTSLGVFYAHISFNGTFTYHSSFTGNTGAAAKKGFHPL